MEQISFHNYDHQIKKLDISILPHLLQEGNLFFKEAKSFYHQEASVKEAIDLYLEKLNAHVAKQKHGELPSTVYFIRTFVKMHNQQKNRKQLEEFITNLQKAIESKHITKNAPYASHITQIQDKLITQYNKLPQKGSIRLVINKDWLSELKQINTHSIKTLSGFESLEKNQSNIKKNHQRIDANNKTNNLFESINAIDQSSKTNTFRLAGGLGEFLGDLERFELAITIEGNQGSGKTRFTYQLANAFAVLGHRIAIFSLEIGSKSDLIRRMKEAYISIENQSSIFIADKLPEGINTIKKAANQFDVIVIDSWNKVGVSSLDFDSLRKQFPNTIFIVIFQRTTQKTIRGGTAPLYDAGINIEVVKADASFKNNYAVTTKNRYGETGIKFNIYHQQIESEANNNDIESSEFENLTY